uniref:De novo protein with intramolecular isopeptide bond dnIPB-2 n=1 Tax=synthetic construct TaxID=32630 RepID=UPI003BEF4C94
SAGMSPVEAAKAEAIAAGKGKLLREEWSEEKTTGEDGLLEIDLETGKKATFQKVDAETGKPLAGAVFRLYRFLFEENGEFVAERYVLVEVRSPEGYEPVVNTPIARITVTKDPETGKVTYEVEAVKNGASASLDEQPPSLDKTRKIYNKKAVKLP